MGYRNHHHAEVINSLEEYLTIWVQEERVLRKARARWKQHVEKHGNVPMIRKCAVCSGEERKLDRKRGVWKDRRPSKWERDEMKGVA